MSKKVKPKHNYRLLGCDDYVVSKDVEYDAYPAYNQPEYTEKGKIFIFPNNDPSHGPGILLEKGDYDEI